jgi:hypothetical protein
MLLTMALRWAPAMNAHLDNQLAPFPLEFAAYDSYIYWHRQSEDDAANLWLRELVIDAFREFDSQRIDKFSTLTEGLCGNAAERRRNASLPDKESLA